MVHRTLRSALALAVLFLFGATACSDVAGPVAGPEPGSQIPTISAAISPTQVAKLLASDGAAGDLFGDAVSVSGDVAVVGAWMDDDNGTDSGSAYVFERTGGTWSLSTKLLASDGQTDDQFGRAVTADGDVVIVGAGGDDDIGSAYVFERSGGIWSHVAKLTPSDGDPGDAFAIDRFDLSGDLAVIGSNGDDDNGARAGAAYVFERSGGTWSEVAKLLASDGAPDDRFGGTTAVDGDVVVVTALGDDDNGSSSGSAYVFERSDGTWSEVAKLTPSDGAENDVFGFSADLSGDVAVIGARGDDDNGASSGSAYVFDGSAGWSETAKLTASDGARSDFFGGSVAVDGAVAVIGALGDDDNGSGSGSAYVFDGTSGWSETAKLTATDGAEFDQFGSDVSLDADVAVIGARLDDDNGTDSGSAYVVSLGDQVLEVAIDVKPGSDPNPVACAEPETVIPVAILSTREADGEPLDFDATTVDHATVSFEGAAELHVNRRTGEPIRHEEDVDADGDTDLVLHVRLGDTGLTCASTEGSLTGETFDGTAIEGTDAVRTVGG